MDWSPPPENWLKLNTDGVSKGNPGTAGGRGIFRDSRNLFISAYTFHCGVCNAITAELWAVFHGLKSAQQFGYNKVIIETDSSQVYGFLTNKDEEAWANHNVIRKCHSSSQAPSLITQHSLCLLML